MSQTLSEKLEGEFSPEAQFKAPGEEQSAVPLPIGKGAVGSSSFPSNVAVPATGGQIRDQQSSQTQPRDTKGTTDSKTEAALGKE